MKKLYFALLLPLLFSCSSVKFSDRKSKDIRLDYKNYSLLNGSYYNSHTNSKTPTILIMLNNDTITRSNIVVNFCTINDKTLLAEFKNDSVTVAKTLYKGKYKHGYFKVKRKWKYEPVVGPLVWVLVDEERYIGLNKDNNLVIMKAKGGFLMITVFPFFGAESKHINEFKRL